MSEPRRTRGLRRDLVHKGSLVLATALLSAALAACGGGGGDGAPAASAAPTSPPGGSSTGASTGASTNTGTDSHTGSGLIGVASAKGATTLSWQPPSTNDDGTPAKLTGYRIYWGLTEGNYPNSITLKNPGLTRHVVEQLPPGTWYFVATAIAADSESPPSNVVVMKVM